MGCGGSTPQDDNQAQLNAIVHQNEWMHRWTNFARPSRFSRSSGRQTSVDETTTGKGRFSDGRWVSMEEPSLVKVPEASAEDVAVDESTTESTTAPIVDGLVELSRRLSSSVSAVFSSPMPTINDEAPAPAPASPRALGSPPMAQPQDQPRRPSVRSRRESGDGVSAEMDLTAAAAAAVAAAEGPPASPPPSPAPPPRSAPKAKPKQL